MDLTMCLLMPLEKLLAQKSKRLQQYRYQLGHTSPTWTGARHYQWPPTGEGTDWKEHGGKTKYIPHAPMPGTQSSAAWTQGHQLH
jgi:hypothetical protein